MRIWVLKVAAAAPGCGSGRSNNIHGGTEGSLGRDSAPGLPQVAYSSSFCSSGFRAPTLLRKAHRQRAWDRAVSGPSAANRRSRRIASSHSRDLMLLSGASAGHLSPIDASSVQLLEIVVTSIPTKG